MRTIRREPLRVHLIPEATERRSGKRRNVDPTTCEMDYSADELEFLRAIQAYKKQARRPWPTWSEVLEVLRSLGYRKVTPDRPAE